ncbi:ArsR/SmtB family transcription factor [Spirillospora sp. CA-294931]|uniref:ArsR/SmtB family transcription factor n=1 Tax=Spirillospora sp. CA-294931 TaxID=3240042 RepID=UPI003D8B8CB9
MSLHKIADGEGSLVFDGWRRRVRRRLPGSTRRLLELAPPQGPSPDFLTPEAPTLDEGLAKIRAQASPHIADPAARDGLVNALREYHRSALEPWWPLIQAQVHTDLATRGQVLVHAGLDEMLTNLHPAARWSPPDLHLPYPVKRVLHLNGRGLRLLPSFFCWRRPITLCDPSRAPVLVFPIDHDPGWLASAPRTPTHRSLAALLGRTRAVVLTTIAAQSSTTTQIAHRAGVSLAAASQHTAVLREAGLIATQRRGNRSIHTITPAAKALITLQAPAAGS